MHPFVTLFLTAISLAASLTTTAQIPGGKRHATVHLVVVDGFGRDLGEGEVTSFKEQITDQELANRFRQNTARDIPYGIYEVRAHKVGFFTGKTMAHVFRPEVWVILALNVGHGMPEYVAPTAQISGTVKNFDKAEEPIYLRLAGLYSDFLMDTRLDVKGQVGEFNLLGIIPDGKYVLIVVGRTRVLDIRQLEVPAKTSIVIDLSK